MSRLIAQVNIQNVFFGSHRAGSFTSITDAISKILPNVYIIAALILFFYLAFGGLTMVTAGNNPESAKKGGQAVTNAIIGFVVIFASYWIIQIISTVTGIPILNANI